MDIKKDYVDIKELGELYNLMLSDYSKIKDNIGASVFKVRSIESNHIFYGIKANDTMIFMLDVDARKIYEMLKTEFEEDK